jgi:hypothetical protein
MAEKLTWEEIKNQYNQEWVELVDYDWPEEGPDPKSGTVRVHAKTREEFDRLAAIDAPQDSAYVFVGIPDRDPNTILTTFRLISVESINA